MLKKQKLYKRIRRNFMNIEDFLKKFNEDSEFKENYEGLPKTEILGKIALKSKEKVVKLLPTSIESEEDFKKNSGQLIIRLKIEKNIVRVDIEPELDRYFLEFKKSKYSEIAQ